MIKIFIILTLAILSACTSSNSKERQLKADLREAQLNLGTCQSRLEMHTTQSSEPEQAPEPECEEIDYQILTQDNKKLDVCKANQIEETPCGVKATDCESGQGYLCLKDVSYKTVTKKICK